MTAGVDFTKQITETETLLKELASFKKRDDRLQLLITHPIAVRYLATQKRLKSLLLKFKPDIQEILFSLLCMGQGYAVFTDWNKFEDPAKALKDLAISLKPIQKTYKSIGGLVGYQLVFLKLLQRRSLPPFQRAITKPEGLFIDKVSPQVRQYTRAGIEAMPSFGEVYPVGGAADRMNLLDDLTGEPLPQAKLQFEGATLLEGLIRDLHAREILYQKLTGKKTITPIALMTSPEKRNHEHILRILEENNWFNRPEEYFFLFEQPLVPVLSDEGFFATRAPLELSLKPGGHGIIWELMRTNGVFKWFTEHDRDKLLIRQINNPLADTDRNLLTLGGKGAKDHKAFGFLSCSRIVGAAEGMNVIQHSRNEDGYFSSITNVEYTDFSERGLKDEPERPGSIYSPYPANTNILFGYIPDILKALKRLPLPGLLINLKSQISCYEKGGERVEAKGGRVETTMQNLADVIDDFSPNGPVPEPDLRTFILFNRREKTLSVTKKKWKPDSSYEETPQGAWLDRQKNMKELFNTLLNFSFPKEDLVKDKKSFVPSVLIHLHPSMGPLWEVIAQKIRGGSFKKGSELRLELTDLYIKNLELEGSFIVHSPTLKGRAFIKNLNIKNQGLNQNKGDNLWYGERVCHEQVEIVLLGDSEVVIENVTLEGPHYFEVPDRHRMKIFADKGKIKTSLEKITSPSWRWVYKFGPGNEVLLTFNARDAKLLA